jgi:hypothetical protein
VIAIPDHNGKRKHADLDLENSKQDIATVRGLARRGLLSADSIQAISARLERVATTGTEERMRVAADKALSVLQISLMKLLMDNARGEGGNSPVTNQQINIYLPSNGRELTNGHNGNGKH